MNWLKLLSKKAFFLKIAAGVIFVLAAHPV